MRRLVLALGLTEMSMPVLSLFSPGWHQCKGTILAFSCSFDRINSRIILQRDGLSAAAAWIELLSEAQNQLFQGVNQQIMTASWCCCAADRPVERGKGDLFLCGINRSQRKTGILRSVWWMNDS